MYQIEPYVGEPGIVRAVVLDESIQEHSRAQRPVELEGGQIIDKGALWKGDVIAAVGATRRQVSVQAEPEAAAGGGSGSSPEVPFR